MSKSITKGIIYWINEWINTLLTKEKWRVKELKNKQINEEMEQMMNYWMIDWHNIHMNKETDEERITGRQVI